MAATQGAGQSAELEDTFTDVIGKAQRGLGLDDRTLAKKAHLSTDVLAELKSGKIQDNALTAVAKVLNLHAGALVALAKGDYQPLKDVAVEGLESFSSNFDGMKVNSYVAWHPSALVGIAFDTGTDCGPMLKFIAERGLRVPLVLLTHTHEDHVADVVRLKKETGAHVFVSAAEALLGCETFSGDHRFKIGGLEIETRPTTGHSVGGTTYAISGLQRPVAIVGDALFAGSMGGGLVSYKDALKTGRESIFTLPENTILCPGHGPRTTVAHERKHNPFFAV